jgi:hypothetical protein
MIGALMMRSNYLKTRDIDATLSQRQSKSTMNSLLRFVSPWKTFIVIPARGSYRLHASQSEFELEAIGWRCFDLQPEIDFEQVDTFASEAPASIALTGELI